MKILLLLLLSASVALGGTIKDRSYAVSDIPDSLRANVDAVVRKDHLTFEILSRGKGRVKAEYVVTIFNSNGKTFAKQVLDYDRLTKIRDVSATVYDALGNVIKKLKNSEIKDQSAFDGYSLFSDARLKYIDLTQGTYPYTVQIEYEKDYNFLFFIEGSYVLPRDKVSTQDFRYTLIYPTELKPKTKAVNIQVAPAVQSLDGGRESMSWSLANVKPMKLEPFVNASEILPHISAAPMDFEFEGYKGSMKTWDDFGKWINTLNSGRAELPESTKTELKAMTSKAKTTEEKIRIVYEYLQSKTRYVSIQLGIGGFQPFEANVVDKMGYGDCKALSNYTVAMLNSVGVKANYVLINAGSDYRKIDEEFVSSQFNHAIVAVPNGRDTIWLECTSQTNPFGYQGKFTGDRKALLVTENGAQMVNTNRYPSERNIQSRSADVYIDKLGDATASVQTVYSGLQYENDNLDHFLTLGKEDQKKWLQENIDIPAFDIASFSMTNHKDDDPRARVNMNLSLKRLASVNGKRIFLTANLMNRNEFIPEKNDARKYPITRKVGFVDYDTIRYHIPEGIYAESLPSGVKVNSRFGEYESGYSIEEGLLVYTRKLKVNRGTFPANSYGEMIDFYKNISKADNTKVVFLNKT